MVEFYFVYFSCRLVGPFNFFFLFFFNINIWVFYGFGKHIISSVIVKLIISVCNAIFPNAKWKGPDSLNKKLIDKDKGHHMHHAYSKDNTFLFFFLFLRKKKKKKKKKRKKKKGKAQEQGI